MRTHSEKQSLGLLVARGAVVQGTEIIIDKAVALGIKTWGRIDHLTKIGYRLVRVPNVHQYLRGTP